MMKKGLCNLYIILFFRNIFVFPNFMEAKYVIKILILLRRTILMLHCCYCDHNVQFEKQRGLFINYNI